MKTKKLLSVSLLGAGLAHLLTASADDKIWNVASGDFLNPANWQGGVPGPADIAIVNNGGTSSIPASADIAFGSVSLGSTQGSTESGHVIMNGGTLRIGADSGDPKAVIGLSTTLSTFVMNGGTFSSTGRSRAG